MKLSAYLSKHGSKTELARAIGAQSQLVWQWSTGIRPVPASRCIAIEQATHGAVSRRDLRPDDWQSYWPELATAPATHAPAATEIVATVTPLLLNIDSSDQERREADQRNYLNRRDGERHELGRRTNSIATS